MKPLLIAICFVVLSFIIKENGFKRFIWFLLGVSFFSMDIKIVNSPPLNAHLLFILGYIISLAYHGELMKSWKRFPMQTIMLVLFFTHLMIGLMDERLNLLSKISRPVFTFAQTYLCLLIGYTSFKKRSEWIKILNGMMIIFCVIGVYGLVTYFLKGNPYYDFVWTSFFDSNEKGIWSEVQTRGYRVCSTFNNPIPYGFVMGVVAILLISQTRKQTPTSILMFVIIISNLFLSNSRTSLLAIMLLLSIYVVLLLRYRSNAKYLASLLSLLLLSVAAYLTVPVINTSVNNVIDIFTTGGSSTQGTTTELKQGQWFATLFYFQNSPFWGNGFSYFLEDISAKGFNNDLYGLEGYIFKLLVEEGIIQAISVLIFFFLLFRYYLSRWNRVNTKLVSFSLGMTGAFLFFIIATGTYGNIFLFIFSILGVFLRRIELTLVKV